MRVALLTIILVCWLSITAVTTEQVREASIDANDVARKDNDSHDYLRHAKPRASEEKNGLKEAVISGELGETSHTSSRALQNGLSWSKWQRTQTRGDEKKVTPKKKTKKKAEQDEEYCNWFSTYRTRAKIWRKRLRRKGKAEEIQRYVSKSGVFHINLPTLSSKIAYGYSDCRKKTKNTKMMKRDMTEALQFKVKLLLERGDQYAYRDVDFGDPIALPAFATPEEGGGDDSPKAGSVDDFGTNTVEENIDEGDRLKVSDDGKYAFVVYGGNIVVWNVEKGNSTVTTMALPIIDVQYERPPPGPQPRPIPILREREPEPAEELGDKGNDRDLQAVRDALYYCWGPIVPTIHSLMVYQTRLVVIASGYMQSIQAKLDYDPAFYDAFATKILVYDISTLDTEGKLTLLKETDVHGRFDSIRAIENRAYLVTFSSLDTYTHIDGPLSRSQPEFKDMDDGEYRKAARRLAKHTLIPKFVDRVVTDISASGEEANIARVSMWQKNVSPDSKLEESVFSNGIMNHYAQITSFDMLVGSDESSKELEITQSGAFMPTSYGHTYLYAAENMLIVAGQGWDYIGRVGASRQTTYFLGFALLENGRVAPAAVGSLDGHLLNEYAVKIVNGYMRVAVTIRNNMWWFAESTENVEIPPTQNFVKVLKIPDVKKLSFTGSGPLMEEVGSTDSLGEENEVITGVRFGEKVAYLITFFQTDPLYVILFPDSDETNPKVAGELKITGFSRYLHFVNKENTYLLGVGQEADEEGRVLGLQVRLFDATDPTKPIVVKGGQYSFELEENAYSSSAAEFDFKAFRYIKLGEDKGILIIPFRVNAYNTAEDLNFNGFALLDVDIKKGISERFRIRHKHPVYYRLGCYQSVDLPQRSFVVDGEVTTTKGHTVLKHNLDKPYELLDSFDLDSFVLSDGQP